MNRPAVGPEENFYEILEVGRNATLEEIENAYHKAMSYLSEGSLALYSMLDEGDTGQQRERVELAYRTLSDPDRRAAYDAHREQDSDYPPNRTETYSHPHDYPSVVVRQPEPDPSTSLGHLDHPEMIRSSPPASEPVSRAKDRSGRTEPLYGRHAPETSPYGSRYGSVPASGRDSPGASISSRARLTTPPVRRMPVDLNRSPRRRFEPPQESFAIDDNTEVGGSFLKRVREGCAASLDDVAEITKISKRYIKALENDDFDSLPAAVYVRGFVVEFARVFGMDPERVAKSYMSRYKRYRGGR